MLNHEFGDDEPELGYLLLAGAEGKGYASEAAQAAAALRLRHPQWPSVVSYIDPANARSIALVERLGATLDTAASDADLLVYRHLASGGTE